MYTILFIRVFLPFIRIIYRHIGDAAITCHCPAGFKGTKCEIPDINAVTMGKCVLSVESFCLAFLYTYLFLC